MKMRETIAKSSKETLNDNETEKELFCSTFQKSSPKEKLRTLLENNEDATVTIKIGEWTFDCHLIVLQCYSQLFKRHSFARGTIVELPEEHVSSEIFTIIYKWMLEDEPMVERTEIVQLLIAACYLEIDHLAAQIWNCLNNVENLPEDAAYFLYLEASEFRVKCLRKKMLSKISKFFLTMVAFKEFLLMPVGDLCTLIASDAIGVNTEIEVFMVALRWISYNWSKRKKYIFRVMKNVRFSLIPPGFLIELDRNMIEIDIVKRVMARQKVKDLVSDGLKHATTRLCYGKFIPQSSSIKERHWIYDANCEYHLKTNQLIEYKITYSKFFEYLNDLQKCHQNYWNKLEDIGDSPTPATSSSGSRQQRVNEMIRKNSISTSMKDSTDTDTSQHDVTASSSYFTIEESYPSSQTTFSSNKNTINKIPHKDGAQLPALCKYNVDKCENFHEQIEELQKLTHRINTSSVESSRSISSDSHYHRQGSDSPSFSKFDSLSIPSHSKSCELDCNEKESHSSDDVAEDEEEEIEQSDHSSETSSYISIFSLTKSVYKKSGMLRVKKSVSQTTCLASIEKNTKKSDSQTNFTQTQTQSNLNGKHHRFDFKNVNLKEMLSNLALSTNKSNVQQNPKKKKSDHHKNSKDKRIEGAGVPPIVARTTINLQDLGSLFDNKTLLILGGSDPYGSHHAQSSIDPVDKILFYSNRFKQWAQMRHTSFGTRQHHSAVACNGLVYIVGGTKWVPGCKLTIFENAIWNLNPETKKWTFETNLPKSRRDFAVITVDGEPNERGFYVIGGESLDKMPLNSVWFYNTGRKTWLRKAPLNRSRYGFSASIVNNEIWIAGGIAQETNAISTDENRKISDSIEIFKLADGLGKSKGKWFESKYRLRKRCLFGKLLTVEGKRAFLIGGIGPDDNGNLHSYDAIDRFDFESKNWLQCAKLQDARHGHEAVLMNDFIAIIGGVSSRRKCALQSIEMFCLQTNQVLKIIPNLPRPLSGLAAVVVNGEW